LVRGFLREGVLAKRVGSLFHMLTGNFAASLIGLAAFALTARALGPLDYGILAMVHTYARAIERIVSFQSWQPLIKYGAALEGPEHKDNLKVLMKFGLLLDVLGSGASWLVAVVLALAGSSLFGWDQRIVNLVLIYCTMLLFNANGMATAVTRLTGRFKVVAYGQVVNAAVRVALCALGLLIGGGLMYFALIWMVMPALGALLMNLLAFRELHRSGVHGVLRAPLRGVTKQFPQLWNFALSTNLSLTIRTSAQEFDTLLVGVFADPASAGFYHIAKRIARLAQQAGVQVQAVVYPDIARHWARREFAEVKRSVMQVETLLACFGIASLIFLVFTAEPLLRLAAGPQFVEAATLLIVQMIAVVTTLSGVAVRAGLLAMGLQKQVLTTTLMGTLAFYATALSLLPVIGAMGANIAHIVMGSVNLISMSLAFRKGLAAAAAGQGGQSEQLAVDEPSEA
jgi:O-antigen/teichoic acid export membrane protein